MIKLQPNEDRVEDINDRMYWRNLPSAPIQAYFDARPVSTKYALMPLVDRRPKSTVPIALVPVYNQHEVFLPGTAAGPWGGFANNVNDESRLRNQFYGLQRANQAEYVPSTRSDMYVHTVHSSAPNQQPFPDLFSQPHLEPFNPNPNNELVGFNLFDNCTRQQVKGDVKLQTPSTLQQVPTPVQ